MNIKYQWKYLRGLLKRYGFLGLVYKALERSRSPMLAYSGVWQEYMPSEEELARQRKDALSYAPLVSIVVPAFETPEGYLRELIGSVTAQTYPNWELCIADGSKTDAVARVAGEYAAKDDRIRVKRLSKNGGISENTNAGFAMAKGEYIALMDHDDLLAANALYEMAKCLNEAFSESGRELAMIYSDEDKINGDGSVHSRPHFKPDYNLEFLRRNNYFCHFLLFSRKLLQKAGGLQKEYDGAQDYDFVLRCVDAGAIVRHVPKILYHWRIHEGSTAGNSEDKAYAFDNGCLAIEEHLKRRGEEGRAGVTANLGVYRVRYSLRGEYRVTVAAESDRQMQKIRNHYEKISYDDKEYRLKLSYAQADDLRGGIEKGRAGDYILYIRKDVSAEPQGLVEGLLRICQHAHTGITGAKLLSPNRRVVSCGLIYGREGRLLPACGGIPAAYKGYFLHAVIPQNVSAVSFGCVMLRRDAYERVGGMDESLRGIYRDADYCFRLQEAGFGVAVTPEVVAICALGQDGAADEDGRRRFAKKHAKKLERPDPCYNCNLSLENNHSYALKKRE